MANLPWYGTAFSLTVHLFTLSGLIANPGTLTCKISKDWGDYADCHGIGPTEEDSVYGQIKVALDATDMTATHIDGVLVDDTSGCLHGLFHIDTIPVTRGLSGTALPDAIAGEASGVSVVGSAMNLADDAITAGKFDETTAFPLVSADTGATAVARTGADSDTLETLSDQLDDVPNNTEFEARTLVAADYVVVGDTIAGVTTVNGFAAGAIDNAAFAEDVATTTEVAQEAADEVRTELTTELAYLDAAVSTRSTLTAQQVWEYATRTLSAFGFNVTVDTNNDKTGYSLTADYDAAKTAAQATELAKVPKSDGAVTFNATALEDIAERTWSENITGAEYTGNMAGRKLINIDVFAVDSGTAQAGGVNTVTLAATASAVDNYYDPGLIIIESGTGAGQTRRIIDYNGATKVATVQREWRVQPDATSTYIVVEDGGLLSLNDGPAAGGGEYTITLNSIASSVDQTYKGCTIALMSGTGKGQTRVITDYDGDTKVATVCQPWATQPAAGTAYVIVPSGKAIVAGFADDVITSSAIDSTAITAIQNGLALASTALSNITWTDAKAAMLDAAITSRLASADYTAPDNTNIGNIKSTVDSATYGLAALKVLIDNIDDYVDVEVSSIKGVTDKLDTAMVVDGDVYKFTANALEEVAVDISGLSTFDPDTDTVDIGKVNGVAVTNIDDFKAEPPTVGEIADEVRVELATELARIDENISAPKTLADGELDGISTLTEVQVTAAINSAVPTALDAYDIATLTDIQGTLRGSGASEGTVLVTDTEGDPIADADVWVTTDEAGALVVAGTLQSDSNGNVIFWLDAGVTYYIWCQKDGKNFSNPTEFIWQ